MPRREPPGGAEAGLPMRAGESKTTSMAVMLSRLPRVRHSSSSRLVMVVGSLGFSASMARQNWTASSLVMTSQMPSQASSRNSSDGCLASTRMSGAHVTCWASGGRSLRALNEKSPKARDTWWWWWGSKNKL